MQPLLLSSLILGFLYLLQYCEIYILSEQLRSDAVLVTLPQFFNSGQIKRMSYNRSECVGIHSISCNGMWSCTKKICRQSVNPDTRYVVTYPLDKSCNSSYFNYKQRIRTDDALWYYNFVDTGTMLEFNIAWLLFAFTIMSIVFARGDKFTRFEFTITLGFMLILYCVNIILIAIMFGFKQKFVSAQEKFTQDYRPDVVSTSSTNISNTFIVLLSFQFLIGIIQHYLIYLQTDTKDEVETPLIQ